MPDEATPLISSFVIRFIYEKLDESVDMMPLRGTVRHIQTEQELMFTRWPDALNFMQQFLPPDAFDQSQ